MKRFLLVVLLFASGLWLLVRLERSDPAGPAGAEGRELAEPPTSAEPDGSRSAVLLNGSFVAIRYAEAGAESRRRLFELTAVDTASLEGGETVFERVHAILHDPESGNVKTVIDALRGTMYVRESGLRYPIDLEQDVADDALWMEDVTVVLREGAPVVPLTVRVPVLEGDLAERLFTSTEHATVAGPGLHAQGTGLLLDLVRGVVRFDREGEVELADPVSGRASLESSGKMHILRRDPQRDGGVEVVARDGAELRLRGADPALVRGRWINVIARETPADASGEGGLKLSRLTADGDALVELSIGRFEGGRADLRAAGNGERYVAELREAPRAVLSVVDPELSGGDPVAIRVWGDGPLTAEVSREESFELVGPARAEWGGNQLFAGGGLRGFSAPKRRGFTVSAWGGVYLQQETARLETDALELTVEPREGREALVQVTTGGPSTLTGVARGGDPFVLDAGEQVVYRQEGEDWFVPLAVGVELEVEGDEPLQVRADRVEDLRVGERTLVAEGDVSLRRGDQRASGERFESLAAEHFVLFGTPEAPAFLASPELYIEGRRMERRGRRLLADGDAAAQFMRAPWSGEIHCDTLHARLDELDYQGRPSRGYELWTGGEVQLSLQGDSRRGEVECDSLHAVLVDAADQSVGPLGSYSLLELDGNVRARVSEKGMRYVVRSQSAVVDHRTQDAGEPLWRATAQGKVTFEGEGESTFTGRGDVLTLDQAREARLEGLDGRLVAVRGLLPGGRHPFFLQAPAVRFSKRLVRAEDVLVRVRRLSFVPGPGPAELAGPEIEARAAYMSALAGALLLSGDVAVTGVDPDGIPVELDTGFLRFEGSAGSEGEESRFRDMNAWGGFDLRYGDSLHAAGDRLEVNATTGRLRVMGTPALIEYGDFQEESEFLEYDLFLRIIVESAGGILRPRGSAPPPPR